MPDQSTAKSRDPVSAEMTLALVGDEIKRRRLQMNLTLEELSKRTGISRSMLSLVERGKATPSVGTLVTVAAELRVPLSELFAGEPFGHDGVINRFDDQSHYVTQSGVHRRIVRSDSSLGLDVAVSTYPVGTFSSPVPISHAGFELGVVMLGTLHVELGGVVHVLNEGDSIGFPSAVPHRKWNDGPEDARVYWVEVLIYHGAAAGANGRRTPPLAG